MWRIGVVPVEHFGQSDSDGWRAALGSSNCGRKRSGPIQFGFNFFEEVEQIVALEQIFQSPAALTIATEKASPATHS